MVRDITKLSFLEIFLFHNSSIILILLNKKPPKETRLFLTKAFLASKIKTNT